MIDKTVLFTHIRTLRRELDELENKIFALEEPQPVSSVSQGQDRDAWLTVRDVCECLKISQATFYEYVKNGLFPAGFEFGPRSKRWKLSDIEAWQKSKRNEAENKNKLRNRSSRVRQICEFCNV